MAKGENIFRRRDGRWEARYIKGRELSGKIKYGYCYGKTYREAKVKAAKHKAALENGVLLPTATTQKPFSSYCLGWLHTKKCTVKESTYIKYSTVVNKHIMPKLGECCPLGFTTELMDDFIKELQFEEELAPKTVHDILVVLHGILKFASSKFAGSFPAVEINYPKIGKKEMRVLSREEQARLVAYLHEDLDSCRFGILLALCTGIRIGELCALQWESVSTNDKAIRIAKTLQRLHDTSVSQGARTRIVIGPPKSDTSVRTIPMTEYATGLCRRMKPQSSAAYVLTGTEAFMEPRTLQYRLEKYTQACGLEGVHFHTLRHPYVKHTTKIFSLRLMDFQAQAYPDARRKTRGACQLLRVGQSRSPVRPLCNRKRFSCLPPQSKMSWILYAISMRLSGYTSTRSISSSASSVVSVSASKIALDASMRLSCRACSSCFCFACANTAA